MERKVQLPDQGWGFTDRPCPRPDVHRGGDRQGGFSASVYCLSVGQGFSLASNPPIPPFLKGGEGGLKGLPYFVKNALTTLKLPYEVAVEKVMAALEAL